MRQEGNNTFTKGLIQDLNPINTPNDVLTDNLNGTIITYDGNEFSLQNDRGNYPLQYCKLKPNYIPVGVKEYADTLYIVSYNPLNNTTEIGSYPSPLEISTSTDKNDITNIQSLIYQAGESGNYTDLLQKTKMHVFSDEDLKLYPGDEYQIKLRQESEYIYEELEYYIIDENRNKYNVTEYIKENSPFNPVGWTVPGWMAVQYRLAVFEDFQMNLRSFVVPTLAKKSNGKLALNFQLKISDKLLLNRLDTQAREHLDEIGLNISITKTHRGYSDVIYSESKLFQTIDGKFIEWYETSKILWAQKEFELQDLNQGDQLSVTVTPFIQVNVNNHVYKVVYDNFTEKLDVTLANVGSFSDFNIANDVWKFWIEEDDPDNLYMEFDISGPLVTSNTTNLYYKITPISDLECQSKYKKLESYNGVGQNMILINFDNDVFKPEGIYVINFVFSDKNPNESLNDGEYYSIKKLIIASQIFSSFVKTEKNFENITFDQWTEKYKDTVKNSDKWDIIVNSDNTYISDYNRGDISSGLTDIQIPTHLKKFWTTKSQENPYIHSAFVKEEDWDVIEHENTEILRGYKIAASADIATELEILTGPMWDGLNRDVSIKIKSHNEELVKHNYSADSIEKKFNINIQPIVANKINISYRIESTGLVRGSTGNNNHYAIVNQGGIRYGILMGKDIHSGSNNYVQTHFKGFNKPLTKENAKNSKFLNLLDHNTDNNSIPNKLTREISSFMTANKLPFIIVFIAIRSAENNNNHITVVRNDDVMFNESSKSIVKMQPFFVCRNKSGNPLFFEMEGYGVNSWSNEGIDWSNEHSHYIPFENWEGLDNLIYDLNAKLGTYIQYYISDLYDGYFLNCEYDYDESHSILNVSTEVSIPEINSWKIGNYDILNRIGRDALKESLNQHNIKYGNLFSGFCSALPSLQINGSEYNNYIENNNIIKNKLAKFEDDIHEIQNNASAQWLKWKQDDAYQLAANSSEISGSYSIGDDTSQSYAFKQSSLYNLIQKSQSSDLLTINASGDKLKFEVRKNDKLDKFREDAEYYIGYIHSSIKFP